MKIQIDRHEIVRLYLLDTAATLGPLFDRVNGLNRSRNLKGLSSCSSLFDPALQDREVLKVLRQVEAFVKKAPPSDKDATHSAAWKKFQACELRCKRVNTRLQYFDSDPGRFPLEIQKQIKRMRSYISMVLGDFEPFLESLPNRVRLTPGATCTTSRKNSLPFRKVKMSVECNRSSFPYIAALYRYYGFKVPRWKNVYYNRVEMVPKNWKTDRPIACEPTHQLPLQLAFDNYMKGRLKAFGTDLSDQSLNQNLAKVASMKGFNLSTIDFSSASDTISLNCVALLLPDKWFKYLSDCRSSFYKTSDGELVPYHKFSSMGNGSTFPLETLIFKAACVASGSRISSVYGDDVIIDNDSLEQFTTLCRFLGFTINRDKSFSTGSFRESCGHDYYDGVKITPFYLREIDQRRNNLCHIINNLVLIAQPYGRLWDYLISICQSYNLPQVPYNHDTTSGIHIPAVDCHDRKCIRRDRRDPNQLTVKQYVTKSPSFTLRNSQTYYLWFLKTNNRERSDYSYECTSKVPTLSHKYVLKWVHWIPPVTRTPAQLYSWAVLLPPRKGREQ